MCNDIITRQDVGSFGDVSARFLFSLNLGKMYSISIRCLCLSKSRQDRIEILPRFTLDINIKGRSRQSR